MSYRVPPQWIDCEVDVKVELQSLGLHICVFNSGRNILGPQFKKHLVVSIIKRPQEVFLEKPHLFIHLFLVCLFITQ